MTFYGPWITPPVQTISATVNPFLAPVTLGGTNFAVLAEGTGSNGSPSLVNTGSRDGFWTVDPLGQFNLSQVALDVDVAPQIIATSLWVPPHPWPARAVDVDATGAVTLTGLHASVGVIDTMSGFADTAEDVHLFLTSNAPADLTYQPGNGGLPDGRFIPGAAVTAYGTAAFPAASGGQTVSGDVPVAHIPTAYPITGRQAVQFVVGVTEQITHTAPTSLSAGASGRRWRISAVAFVLSYQPAPYRYVFDVLPPLRQYPRDDYIGGAPRQGSTSGSRSVQVSARQGWANTYR